MSFHISGLASNLDTSKIIADLMKLERLPYTRLETKKGYLQSEQNVFRNVNTKLSSLQTALADLKYVSTFNLSSAKSTNESSVKATAKEGASVGNFNIEVTQLAKSHTVKTGVINSTNTDLLGKSFEVNGIEIDISHLTAAAGSTNADVIEYVKNQINKNDWGINASVMTVDDSGNKVLMLSSKVTGEASKIAFHSDPENATPLPGPKEIVLSGNGFEALPLTTTQDAKDARFNVNGIEVVKSSNTVSDVISGVTLELLKDNSTSTVTVNTDGDKVADKVEAFVKAYNEIVTLVKDNLAKPADDKKMNPLQGDSLLKDISTALYSMFTATGAQSVGGNLNDAFSMMSQIGLTIDKGITKANLLTGKITFDKEAFKNKLAEDPNAVAELFRNETSGIITTIDKRIQVWTRASTGMMASKIGGYDAEIKMVDERMMALDNRLTMKEQQLKKQFTAMEVSLSKLKAEQTWLSNQLASLSSLSGNNQK